MMWIEDVILLGILICIHFYFFVDFIKKGILYISFLLVPELCHLVTFPCCLLMEILHYGLSKFDLKLVTFFRRNYVRARYPRYKKDITNCLYTNSA